MHLLLPLPLLTQKQKSQSLHIIEDLLRYDSAYSYENAMSFIMSPM